MASPADCSECRPERSLGVVLMGTGGTEHGHQAGARDRGDSAAERLHMSDHVRQCAADQLPHVLGAEPAAGSGWSRKFGKENAHEPLLLAMSDGSVRGRGFFQARGERDRRGGGPVDLLQGRGSAQAPATPGRGGRPGR